MDEEEKRGVVGPKERYYVEDEEEAGKEEEGFLVGKEEGVPVAGSADFDLQL